MDGEERYPSIETYVHHFNSDKGHSFILLNNCNLLGKYLAFMDGWSTRSRVHLPVKITCCANSMHFSEFRENSMTAYSVEVVKGGGHEAHVHFRSRNGLSISFQFVGFSEAHVLLSMLKEQWGCEWLL